MVDASGVPAHPHAPSLGGVSSRRFGRPCVDCGATVLRHGNTKRCVPCHRIIDKERQKRGQAVRRHLRSVAIRDCLRCGICGGDVDMTLRWPDPGMPTIDHVVPMARGGSDDPENLQLAHYLCNISKGARS